MAGPAPGYNPAYVPPTGQYYPQQPPPVAPPQGQPAPPPNQQGYYPPQGRPQPQQKPEDTDDFAEGILKKYKGLRKVAKEINRDVAREEKRQQQQQQPTARDHAYQASNDRTEFDDWVIELEYLEDIELEREMRKHRRGGKEWRAIMDELERRKYEEEFGNSEYEESELLTFYGICVDDGQGGWIGVHKKHAFESKEDMIESVKQAHPLARKLRYSKVKTHDGITIHDGAVSVNIRTEEEVKLNFERERNKVRVANGDLTAYQPPQVKIPEGTDQSTALIMKSMSEQTTEIVRSLLARPQVDETQKFIAMMEMSKNMFVEPMIKIMEANKPQPGDPRLSLDMTNAMVENAVKLGKLGGGGGGGGADNMLETLMGAAKELGPLITRQQQPQAQAQQQPQALPAPAQDEDLPQEQPGAQFMKRELNNKIGGAIRYLVDGKLNAEQLPRYAIRKLTTQEVGHILGLGPEGFAALVRNIALQQSLPASYFEREDVQQGFVWVFEEIARMAIVMNYYESNGRMNDREKLKDWSSPVLVPWQNGQPVIGEAAQEIFVKAHPEAVKALDADLPEPDQVSMHDDLPPAAAGQAPGPAPQAPQTPHQPARRPQRPSRTDRPLRKPRGRAPAPQNKPNLRAVPPADEDLAVPLDPFADVPEEKAGNNGATRQQETPKTPSAPARARASSDPDFV